ncbi:hypothetical protein SAMN05421854_104270 [Amycolatopsis rubida]|uniref:Uncharacterized protein n=1 Tax=Amycolatopsis rubida TaxID=112413 RepID=A0A1I5N6I4_9PSEU|nr:hypothetical protein [Amycolatopsis rubida]SFP17344.1 hypothetical protein SAMN05421854_104270 [Amycolatopsis rubida]
MRVSTLPWRVSVTVRQPCCHDRELIPASWGVSFAVVRIASPRQASCPSALVRPKVVAATDAVVKSEVVALSGTQVSEVRPNPATVSVSPAAGAVRPRAIGVTLPIGAASSASTRSRSGRGTGATTFAV